MLFKLCKLQYMNLGKSRSKTSLNVFVLVIRPKFAFFLLNVQFLCSMRM